MNLPVPDRRLFEGIDLFNAGEYFACHDVWEELWSETLGPERTFYKGLIHVTVAVFHHSEGNPAGGRKMARSARQYLAEYPGDYLGLDIKRLLQDLEACDWNPSLRKTSDPLTLYLVSPPDQASGESP